MPSENSSLLTQWHDGDRAALERLLERNLPFVHALVRRKLGAHLRTRKESLDLVQDVAVRVLESVPRFLTQDEDSFRALLARLVMNAIIDQHDHLTARKRDMRREHALGTDVVLLLDRDANTPSSVVQKREHLAWIRLALELLPPAGRHLLELRDQQSWSFSKIASHLAISEDAARKRYKRALWRLMAIVDSLRRGEVEEALLQVEDDEATD